ncbi:hypothetical protein [Spongiactinospora sp. 9N601]|uniref:hypothetical protein n=1 Tax=Spongiactinospora sp. 9N601 TaxID=3375149 RepID=UPI00379D77D6
MTRPRLWMTANRWFAGVLALGVLLRVLAMLGFQPALWFPDTYTYVVTAMRPSPDLVRPAGYSFFLLLLRPFHSFGLVVFVQHALGVTIGVLVHTVARRLRAPRWAATLAAAPVLLDAYQIELEHLLVSDTLFAFLVLSAVCLGISRAPRRRTACAIGLLVAAATLTRSVGLPLIIVIGAWLLLRPADLEAGEAGEDRRRGARGRAVRAGVMAAAALIPIFVYGGWFYASHQRAGLVGANGVFLYARTMSFADCSVMRPPPDLAQLCDPLPPSMRPPSQEYIWSVGSPLVRRPGITFSAENDSLAGRFALLAIRSQPLAYVGSVVSELTRTFAWDRPVYPDAEVYAYYEFPERPPPPPGRYPARVGAEAAKVYEEGEIGTRIVEPFAGMLRAYQDVVHLPGIGLLAVLLIPPGAVLARLVRRARRLGTVRGAISGFPPRSWKRAVWTLPWTVAWVLLVTPAAVAEFDYRYVLPAVPLATLAAVICVRREDTQADTLSQ